MKTKVKILIVLGLIFFIGVLLLSLQYLPSAEVAYIDGTLVSAEILYDSTTQTNWTHMVFHNATWDGSFTAEVGCGWPLEMNVTSLNFGNNYRIVRIMNVFGSEIGRRFEEVKNQTGE